MPVTHHHSPSHHYQLDLHVRGEGWDAGPQALWAVALPWDGVVLDPKPWEDLSHPLEEREPDLLSGHWSLPCMWTYGSKSKKDEGKLPGVSHTRACTKHCHPFYSILGLDSETPMHLDHSCGNQIISIGTRNSPAKAPGRATGVPSPRTREVNWVNKGKGVSSIWGVSAPNSHPWIWGLRNPSTGGVWGV